MQIAVPTWRLADNTAVLLMLSLVVCWPDGWLSAFASWPKQRLLAKSAGQLVNALLYPFG